MGESSMAAMAWGTQALVQLEGMRMGMLQQPDPRGGGKLLLAQLFATKDVPQSLNVVPVFVPTPVTPSFLSTSLPDTLAQVPFSSPPLRTLG